MNGNNPQSQPDDVTKLLLKWCDGDVDVGDLLMPMVYDELRKIARAYLYRERKGHTLETSALVNEAYLKLIDQSRVKWVNRAHFFAIAAQTMRRILVDHARARASRKRGGDLHKVPLEEAIHKGQERPIDLVALDDALDRLAESDELKSKIIELRFFGGLTHDEIAEVVGMSLSTVERQWRLARAWLFATMAD